MSDMAREDAECMSSRKNEKSSGCKATACKTAAGAAEPGSWLANVRLPDISATIQKKLSERLIRAAEWFFLLGLGNSLLVKIADFYVILSF